jgi:hypothetical protein
VAVMKIEFIEVWQSLSLAHGFPPAFHCQYHSTAALYLFMRHLEDEHWFI